eukprot:gene8573-8755_t
MGALSKIAGVRSSQFGAQATSSIRSLPNQQQLLLYALSVLCSPRSNSNSADPGGAAASPAAVSHTAAGMSSLWKSAGSAVALSSLPGSTISPGGRKGGKGSSKLGRSSLGSDASLPSQQVFVLAAGLEGAFVQYRHVCKLLALPACSKPELLHMAELLAQAALVDVIRPAGASCAGGGGGGGGGGSPGLGGSSGSLGSRRGLGPLMKGRGLGGLGKSLLAGAGMGGGCGRGGLKPGSSQQQQQQGEVKLSLRASAEEVVAALRHNPALRCLVEQ